MVGHRKEDSMVARPNDNIVGRNDRSRPLVIADGLIA
jgi:hypothetical protein